MIFLSSEESKDKLFLCLYITLWRHRSRSSHIFNLGFN